MSESVRIGMLSLGCPRTLVDSEVLLGRLKRQRYAVAEEVADCDVAIVNTCSFIAESVQESIESILDVVELKRQGKLRAVIVAGCLPQRYPVELYDELKDVDGFMGVDGFDVVDQVVADVLAGKRPSVIRKRPQVPHVGFAERVALTPQHYAYLKISEGCLKGCSFCIIPKLKGPLHSRPLDDVVAEARMLVEERGCRELIVVGQDTSDYGVDLYGQPRLVELLDRLSSLDGVTWVRLLYCHPRGVTDGLMDLLATRPTLARYLDMAIEHSEDAVLQRMNRGMTRAGLASLIIKLRERVRGIALRTSVIVGFPGETAVEFEALCDFLRWAKFDRLGAFMYAREQGTASFNLPDQVPQEVKQSRYDRLMLVQQEIAREIQARQIGRELLVHIDEQDGHDPRLWLGRSHADCPDVDGVVYVKGADLTPGDFVLTRITDAYEYDLVGVPV